jgi:hypothetical protein
LDFKKSGVLKHDGRGSPHRLLSLELSLITFLVVLDILVVDALLVAIT